MEMRFLCIRADGRLYRHGVLVKGAAIEALYLGQWCRGSQPAFRARNPEPTVASALLPWSLGLDTGPVSEYGAGFSPV